MVFAWSNGSYKVKVTCDLPYTDQNHFGHNVHQPSDQTPIRFVRRKVKIIHTRLYMRACMHVCMHVCMHACVFVCIYVRDPDRDSRVKFCLRISVLLNLPVSGRGH